MAQFSIRVYKQYFNFASAHFLLFHDGGREPLHGHNYRVSVEGHAPNLLHDMVFDFLDIKPIVREVCDEFDHKVILPQENPYLRITEDGQNFQLCTPDESLFSLPKKDVLLLPISNTSAERLAMLIAQKIQVKVQQVFSFEFLELKVEVEETPGQSAVYLLKKEKSL